MKEHTRRGGRRSVTALSFTWSVAVLACAASASADGGLIITEEVRVEEVPGGTQASAALEGLVSSSGQRAVLWLADDGCWDLYVDPGDVAVSGAAWIMPLPVVPSDVAPASADFVDQLDAATLPVLITQHTRIVEYYTYSSGSGESGCGFGGMDYAAADGEEYVGEESVYEGEEGSGVQPSVRVWQSGRIGDVEYEVVSSGDAAALESWLAEYGYVNPEGLSSMLSDYADTGYAFFAARLVRQSGDDTGVPVFRFTLCGLDGPTYPVRLSTLSVASHLDFTLWLVLPSAHRGYVPSNAGLGTFGPFYDSSVDTDWEEIADFEQLYMSRRAEIHSGAGGRSLAVELATDLTPSAVEQRIDVERESGASFPLSEDRSTWSSELSAIVEGGLRVLRLSGRFPLVSMGEDIELYPNDVSEEPGVYRREVVSYDYVYEDSAPDEESTERVEVEPVFDDVSSCRVSARRGSGADLGRKLPLALVAAATLLLAWRRTRAH